MSIWTANVPLFQDGVSVLNQSSINPVVTALAARDQYLFEMLNNKSDKTVVISYNQPIAHGLANGTPVFFDTTGVQPVLRAAKASYANSTTHLVPDQSAFVFGVVALAYDSSDTGGIANINNDPSGSVVYGDIYVKGLLTDIDFSTLLDTESAANGTLSPGPLYLSSKEAGKLTIYPSGAAIFVGYYVSSTAFVLSPNIDSLNQLYFNYRLYLKSVPAGTVSGTGPYSITHSVSAAADMTNKAGWVTAADAASVLSIVAPTGAKFFYNVPSDTIITSTTEDTGQPYFLTPQQKKDAIAFKSALPAYPSAYTMVFMNGVLQVAYDADHTDGSYIIDENGIWWMLDAANQVPWSGNPGPVNLQLLITKLNPNFGDSVVTSITSANPAITVTGINEQEATSGNLTVKLVLPMQTLSASGNGTAVSNVLYNTTSGVTTIQTTPVVNSIVVGPGLVLNTDIPGKAVLSLSNFSLSGEVSDIEPEESDFVYKGLHSYLRMKNPQANQKIGFVGKLKVPDSIPVNTNLSIKLLAFCDSPTSSSNTVSFAFEYSTSNNASVISSATTTSTVNVPGSNFPTLTQVTIYKDGSDNAFFTIPSTSFSAGSYVNFRISRTNSGYNSQLGVLGVTWVIE